MRPELTPEMILAVEPYMDELVRLRKEVAELRAAVKPAPPSVAELFAAAGLELTHHTGDEANQRTAGRSEWWYRIPLKTCSTGGSAWTEYDAALGALSRFKEMVFAGLEDEEA